ncbi:MAG: MFS transporter [Sphaerochaetaceae bacterium]|nr:MFS transporter [Sphaerochaetaceae bacterium]
MLLKIRQQFDIYVVKPYDRAMLQLYLPSFFVHTISAIMVPYLQIIIRNHGYSLASIGMLLGLFETVGIVSPFILANSADQTGRPRLVLILIAALTAIFAIPLTLSGEPLIIILAISGVAFFFRPIWPIQDAMLIARIGSDLWHYTKLRASGTLGFICFSLLFQFSSLLDVTNNRSILTWIMIAITIYIGSLTLVKRDESIPRTSRSTFSWPFQRRKRKEVVFTKKLWIGIAVMAMNRMSMVAISSFFPLYVTEELQRGELVSVLMAIAAASELIFMLVGGRLLRGGVRPISLIAISSLGLCTRLLIYMVVPTLSGAIIGQLFHSVVYGLFHPAAIMFVNNNIAPERRSVGMALYTSVGVGLPTVIGSALGGYVVDLVGYRGLFGSYTIFALISLVMIFFFRSTIMTRATSQR